MQKLEFDQPEGKDSFVFEFNGKDGTMITFEIDSNSNTEILQQLQRFLTACGYTFFGKLTDYVESKQSTSIMGKSFEEKKEWVNEGYNPDGYRLNQPPKHEPKWDFSNIPNNNWPFGSLKSEPLPTLTTADLSAIKPDNLLKINEYPTMAPLTTEQIQSWSTDLRTQSGEKIRVQF